MDSVRQPRSQPSSWRSGSRARGPMGVDGLQNTRPIEFEVRADPQRPTISGYVYNLEGGYIADRMTLLIERLDASGRVIGSSTTWVLGGVPPGNRSYFSTRVEPAASYRVRVNSFDWIGRGGGS